MLVASSYGRQKRDGWLIDLATNRSRQPINLTALRCRFGRGLGNAKGLGGSTAGSDQSRRSKRRPQHSIAAVRTSRTEPRATPPSQAGEWPQGSKSKLGLGPKSNAPSSSSIPKTTQQCANLVSSALRDRPLTVDQIVCRCGTADWGRGAGRQRAPLLAPMVGKAMPGATTCDLR